MLFFRNRRVYYSRRLFLKIRNLGFSASKAALLNLVRPYRGPRSVSILDPNRSGRLSAGLDQILQLYAFVLNLRCWRTFSGYVAYHMLYSFLVGWVPPDDAMLYTFLGGWVPRDDGCCTLFLGGWVPRRRSEVSHRNLPTLGNERNPGWRARAGGRHGVRGPRRQARFEVLVKFLQSFTER